MTSSLVGSEMCIRDRCCLVLPQFLDQGLSDLPSGECEAYSRALMSATVSYTHLTLPTICSV
eukprot:8520089-Prorocentrum_lima.AAC.1